MKIGVLGGIGPFSSAYFYSEVIRRIAEKPEVQHNSKYPQIIINSITIENNVVENNDYSEVITILARGIKELAILKPDFIVMVCNTVHLYLERIKNESGFHNILNLPDIVYSRLNSSIARQETICVLGSPQTVKGNLYNFSGYNYLNPTDSELAKINQIIYNYSATGDFPKYSNELIQMIQKKEKEGVSYFILCCTEISLLAKNYKTKHLDTLECLIDHVCNVIYENILKMESQFV